MTAAEPVTAEPKPDRSLVIPVLHDIERLRLDLTEVANWLHGHFPAGVTPVHAGPVRVSCHYFKLDELIAARHALEAFGRPVEVTVDDETYDDDPAAFGRAVVHLDQLDVQVQADRKTWAQAFPGEVTS